MGVRYLAAAGAILCLVSVASSAGVARAQHRMVAERRLPAVSTPPTKPLATAVVDPTLFSGAQRATAFAKTRAAGARYVRLAVQWAAIAPSTRPGGFVAGDPSSPGYSWESLDAVVENAVSAGLTPILEVTATPRWAYARRPRGGNAGTPKAGALGQFAHALALHYDGSSGLPALHVFEVWNEPNLSLDLAPVKAAAYRAMINNFANGVHGVDPANLVVAGGQDPFGHPKSTRQTWYSVAPLAYMRSLLCLSKGSHPHATCSDRVHFDVWSHHPYTFGGPFARARLPDDVSLGDLPRMRALLMAGVRLHHVVSARPVQFWVTEFAWDSNPPRPHAAPMSLAARWTAESLYEMWRSGVSLATWFGLQDQASPSPYQSGLYFHSSSLQNARPKPVRKAFEFPFVAYLHHATVSVWGRDATSTRARVAIQLRRGERGRWRTVAHVVANGNGIFRSNLHLDATRQSWLRGVSPGSGRSLAFSLTVPYAPPQIGPWG